MRIHFIFKHILWFSEEPQTLSNRGICILLFVSNERQYRLFVRQLQSKIQTPEIYCLYGILK